MRYLVGFVFVLALGVMGCGETTGDQYPGNCGNQGAGGGSAWLHPGLYRAGWDDDSATYRACVYVNEDCTGLKASTECNIGEDSSQAHFLEVEWTDGRTETGDECAAAVSVTPDLVPGIPITGCGEWMCTSFVIEFSDGEGADWLIGGSWNYDNLFVHAQRTTGDVVCRSHVAYPPNYLECLFGGSEVELCLTNEKSE
jgi:hypothetical protein